jgi:uncharacterized protein YktB (UPF0637 family)
MKSLLYKNYQNKSLARDSEIQKLKKTVERAIYLKKEGLYLSVASLLEDEEKKTDETKILEIENMIDLMCFSWAREKLKS